MTPQSFFRIAKVLNYFLNFSFILGVWVFMSGGIDVLPGEVFILFCALIVVVSVLFAQLDPESLIDSLESRLGLNYHLHALSSIKKSDWRESAISARLPSGLSLVALIRALFPQILVVVFIWMAALLIRDPRVYLRVFLDEISELESLYGVSPESETLRHALEKELERQSDFNQKQESVFDRNEQDRKEREKESKKKNSQAESHRSRGERGSEKESVDGDGSGRGSGGKQNSGANSMAEGAAAGAGINAEAFSQGEGSPSTAQSEAGRRSLGSSSVLSTSEIRNQIEQLKRNLRNQQGNQKSGSGDSGGKIGDKKENQGSQQSRGSYSGQSQEETNNSGDRRRNDSLDGVNQRNRSGGENASGETTNRSIEQSNGIGDGGKFTKHERVLIQPSDAGDTGFSEQVDRSQGITVGESEKVDDFRPPNRYKRFFTE